MLASAIVSAAAQEGSLEHRERAVLTALQELAIDAYTQGADAAERVFTPIAFNAASNGAERVMAAWLQSSPDPTAFLKFATDEFREILKYTASICTATPEGDTAKRRLLGFATLPDPLFQASLAAFKDREAPDWNPLTADQRTKEIFSLALFASIAAGRFLSVSEGRQD